MIIINHNGGDVVDGEGTDGKNQNKSDDNINNNNNNNNPVKVIKRDDIQVTRKSLIPKKQKPNGIQKSKSFTPSTNTQQKDFPFIGKSVTVPPTRNHSSTRSSASASASASRSSTHSHSTASSKSQSTNTASPVSNLAMSRGLSPPPPIILEETAESEEEGSGTSKGKGKGKGTSKKGSGSGSGSGSESDRSSTGSRSTKLNRKKNKRPSPRGIVDAAFLLDEDLKSSITAPTGTDPQQETGKDKNINVDDNRSHGDDTEYALSAIM